MPSQLDPPVGNPLPERGAGSFVDGAAADVAAGDVANVLAFGADKTGTADSSTAIQAALNAARVVYFPPGNYRVDTTLTTGSDRRLWGIGATLKTHSADPVTTIAPAALRIDGTNVVVEGLTFQGVVADHTQRLAYDDPAEIADLSWGGLLKIDATASRGNIRITGCTFTWAAVGISFLSPSLADSSITLQNLTFERCTFRDLMQHAISIKKHVPNGTSFRIKDWHIVNCTFENIYYTSTPVSYDGAIYIGGGTVTEGLTIANCTARNCTTTWLACTSGSAGVGGSQVNGLTITGCVIDGAPPSGVPASHQMGLDLAFVTDLIMSGCVVQNVSLEAVALFNCTHFNISACSFRTCAYGVALYPVGSAGSSGRVSGCSFVDQVTTGHTATTRGVLLARGASSAPTWEHNVQVTGCHFEKGNGDGGSGIYISDQPQPAVVVSACEFVGLQNGINMAAAGTHNIRVQGCRFEGLTGAGVYCAATLGASTIANCTFDGCGNDISALISSYVRCFGNTHAGTRGTAVKLENASWNQVVGCTFYDVAAVHSGTAVVGWTNPVIWHDNYYLGTASAPPGSAGYCITNSQGQRIVYSDAAPAAGTWNVGDLVFAVPPTAGKVWGWICTEAGSPGTWKSMGTLET
jgi:hypothetical protein